MNKNEFILKSEKLNLMNTSEITLLPVQIETNVEFVRTLQDAIEENRARITNEEAIEQMNNG